ncbi:hypothetical protein [Winogradskyella endarachnes]|uniref:Kazal-like domain-containing protein n=1 Tax=Winogradskyella endarachnes TaxID=2681965 RepID=A0A6L6U5U8_9FLAO|nr:hypothetical protein [Winogradskyella endarachnes]MUU77570.1 hypothetical protein [Winogradskyella endarachnes]
MKKLKLVLFSLAFSLLMFTSCTNNESIIENQQQTEESESITAALAALTIQFDSDGNVTQTDNPAGNIVLDFCFDFVYPITLSYNNGTAVTVDDLNGIISILLTSTDQLYVNGIAFPFNVETFNNDTNAIEVVTINNEEEFIDLIEDCDFDDIETCECFEIYDPVCVEITDPSGNTFIVTYPNECYAECDGFEEDDFIENCEEDYYSGGGNECFEFNFPIDIIIENGNVITINSLEDFGNATYNVYNFDFVYPFTISVYDNNQAITVTINSVEDLENILEECNEDYNDDDCQYDSTSLENTLIASCELYNIELYDLNGNIVNAYNVNFNQNGEFIVTGEITVTEIATWNITSTNDTLILNIDGLQDFGLLNGSWIFDCDDDDLEFYNDSYIIELDCDGVNEDCEECGDEPIDPVCVNIDGTTVVFDNACYAICAGYTEADFVFCNSGNDVCLPSAISDALTNNSGWSISDYNDSEEFVDYNITFNSDGTLEWMSNGAVFNGNWSASENSVNGNMLSLSFSGPNLQQASGDWMIIDCDLPCSISLLSNNGDEMLLSRDCD